MFEICWGRGFESEQVPVSVITLSQVDAFSMILLFQPLSIATFHDCDTLEIHLFQPTPTSCVSQ